VPGLLVGPANLLAVLMFQKGRSPAQEKPGFPKESDDDRGRRLCRSSLTADQIREFLAEANERPGVGLRPCTAREGRGEMTFQGWLSLKLLPWH
jgi:hypothetical protein